MDPHLYYGIVGRLANGETPSNLDKAMKRMVEKVADLYTLRKTTLFKLDESRQGTLEPLDTRGRQHRNSRLVITRNQMIATLRQLHDSPLSGHLGQDNTYHKAA
jgi:hypothetical protein